MPKGYRKCCVCGEQVPSDVAKIINNKAYCITCGEARLKEVKDNVALRDYLYKLCDGRGEFLPFLLKQASQLKNNADYGFKTSGILATLKFVFETSENPPIFNPETGIEWIIIRNYYKAKKHYAQIRELEKFPEIEIDEALAAPEKEVHINKQLVETRQKQFRDKIKDKTFGPIIDLNTIEDEEEYDD